MIIVNHECYVSLELAKLLKEAGFDWNCRFAFLPTTERGETPYAYFHKPTNYNDKIKHPYEVYSAPTIDVAQRWLREVKGWDILIRQFEFNKRQKEDGSWEYPYLCELHTKYGKHETFAGYTDAFYKYEEALEAGIKKTLELILEK